MMEMNFQLEEGASSQSSNSSLDCTDAHPLTPRNSRAGNSFSVSFVDRQNSGINKNYGRKLSAVFDRTGRWKIAFIILFAFNIFLCVLIAVGLVMQVLDRKKEMPDAPSVLEKYSEFFMTKTEADTLGEFMKVGATKSKASKVEDVFQDLPGYNCTLVTPKSRTGRSREREAMMVYHGCCETEQSWAAHTTLKNNRNEEVRIIQFEQQQQYFYQDTCVHAMHCTIPCTCRQQDSHVYAVVSNSDGSNVRIEMVKYPGTCKCVNCETSACEDQG